MRTVFGLLKTCGREADGASVARAAAPFGGVACCHLLRDGSFELGLHEIDDLRGAWRGKGLVVSCDAPADGFRDTANQLELQGAGSAEEVAAAAYLKWGEAVADHLAGEFTLVIWDSRERKLLCVRAGFDSSTLYYAEAFGALAFASEPRLLFALGYARFPDKKTIALHLANRAFDDEATLFDGVKRLAPGQMLLACMGTTLVTRHWEPKAAAVCRERSDVGVAAEFLEELSRAVTECRGGERDSGVLLSGGIDSSAITCLARRDGVDFGAYSLVSGEESFDESSYVREVASAAQVRSTEVVYEQEVTPSLSIKGWDRDDVLYSPMMTSFQVLFQKAASDGKRMLLDGSGGDEVFAAGEGHMQDLARSGALFRLWKVAGSEAKVWGASRATMLWRHVLRPAVPFPLRRTWNSVIPSRTQLGSAWLRGEFLESTGALDFIRMISVPAFDDPGQRHIYSALRYGWTIVSQLEELQLLARDCGVVLRHPFLNRRVIQFVMGLPEEQRHRAEMDRFVLRNSMRDIVPERVRLRADKSELATVIDRDLRVRQAASVRELLRESRLAALSAVDGTKLQSAYEEFARGSRAIHASEFETIVGLELWLRNLERP